MGMNTLHSHGSHDSGVICGSSGLDIPGREGNAHAWVSQVQQASMYMRANLGQACLAYLRDE